MYGEDKKPLNTEQLYKQLKAIVEMSNKPEMPVGILTSENRNKWSQVYKRLMKGKRLKVINDRISG